MNIKLSSDRGALVDAKLNQLERVLRNMDEEKGRIVEEFDEYRNSAEKEKRHIERRVVEMSSKINNLESQPQLSGGRDRGELSQRVGQELLAEIEVYRRRVEGLEGKIEEYRSQVKEMQAEVEEKSLEVNSLRMEKDSQKEVSQRELNRLRERYEKVKEEKDALKKQLNRQADDLRASSVDIMALKSKLSSCLSELEKKVATSREHSNR